ncbi:unnamed protein product [Ectocarpus sp. 13 AM-2016]
MRSNKNISSIEGWRQQHECDGLNGDHDPTNRQPRSLTSMLADPRRGSSVDVVETVQPDGELEGVSEFIALSEGLPPFLPGNNNNLNSAKSDNQSSTHTFLTDLFPTGFTSTSAATLLLTPAAATRPAHRDSASTTSVPTEKERELEGHQMWACFTPAAVTSFSPSGVATDNRGEAWRRQSTDEANDKTTSHRASFLVPTVNPNSAYPRQQRGGCGRQQELRHHESDADSEFRENIPKADPIDVVSHAAMTAMAGRPPVARAADGVIARSDEPLTLVGDGNHGETTEASTIGREREAELKQALDRIVPQLLQKEERVKFLEAGLKKANQEESGRNALIKQITTLEEENKQSRQRLDTHQAEALEWRERRQSLEADNERLSTELHSALGRIIRLETETRRKDALLTEARESATARAEKNSTFETELRHKDQLLEEAEQDKKRAWQATNASAETVKSAMMRAEAAAKEASDLRILQTSVRWQDANSGENINFEGRAVNKPGQSLTDVLAASAADGGGPEAMRRSWGAVESDLIHNVPPAGRDVIRHRTSSLGSAVGRSVDHTAVVDIMNHANNKLRRTSTAGIENTTAAGVDHIPPRDVALAVGHPASHGVSLGDILVEREEGNGARRTDIAVSSSSKEPRETRGPGRWQHAMIGPNASPTGPTGDRQHHDSAGVKGALTGANPAWTDTPPLSQAGSPEAIGGCGDRENLGYGRRLFESSGDGAVNSTSIAHREECRTREECRDRGKVCNGHGNTIHEVGLRDKARASEDVINDASTADFPFMMPGPCPAAGCRRGRNSMSSRRSSLSGAGAGVMEVTGEACGLEPDRATNVRQVLPTIIDNEVGSPESFDERQATRKGLMGHNASQSVKSDAVESRSPTDHGRLGMSAFTTRASGSWRRQSCAAIPNERFSSVNEGRLRGTSDSPGVSDKEAIARRERRASAPFATDAAEDELRPAREVERRLTLLQMEISQLEAEQTKLLPKTSKTMQARVQIREIEGRLAVLAKESCRLRRVLREKPWRT